MTGGQTAEGGWCPIGGSVIGSSHTRTGQPNEDAWHASAPGVAAAIAVADGHGSRRCPRAGRGARLAAQIVVEELVALGDVGPSALRAVESPGGVSPPGAPGTGHKPLSLSGSRHPALYGGANRQWTNRS
ncbi:MAG: protein phosphatase 2C domain-containing protein, partial [Egibacteraceae bacterium]